ncbi:MAG: DUF2946 family protein [Alphaproteobacteria bacterium]|nr:DUF2946 family protein [Alphaproteobacteria bacterium]MDE2631406.1 DUF2946 family protein [Alphaproteobacteria bacterium]
MRRQAVHKSAPPLAITLFVLLAFVLQSYATQTHVHFSGERDFAVGAGGAGELAKDSRSQKNEPQKAPSKGDPENCPLCQQITIAGAFISPAALALLLPVQIPYAAPAAAAVAVLSRSVSHSWHGRAPPAV